MEAANNYFSKDFEFEQLQQEIQNNPFHKHHLIPFNSIHTNKLSDANDNNNDEDSEAWNKFHATHLSGKFFKERRYLLKEFIELASCNDPTNILEVGCGTGSTALPILRAKENVTVYATDCSNEALERAKGMIETSNVHTKQRFKTFLSDFTLSRFPNWLACNSCRDNLMHKQPIDVPDTSSTTGEEFDKPDYAVEPACCIGGVDFVTLIFTLSAVPLHRMPSAIAECFHVLKPGGLLLFRDYGLYDMTMLRFQPEQRVGEREYVRSDGTRSYFFCLDNVKDLFCGAGFMKLELEYCCVKSVNRRNGKVMKRVWVHGKFEKPKCENSN
ncbi:hypothetical protein Leryth_008664 [Lithospermum erythrorhizon]|nr:hypothetical protein Leryth_008664 [Lithospermum erythrorhizon]